MRQKMNTEDYVSYPIALALKKAGFEWPCHYGYSVKMRLEPEPSFGEPKMVHSKAPKNYNDNRKGIEKGLEFCSAVPLWQAQKWLREKKNIEVNAVWSYEESDWFTYSSPMCRPQVMDSDVSDTPYSSYEQALSAGIASALELIEKKGE